MVRSERLAEILRQRLAAGTYDLRPFPAERDLAAELGGSYLTVRKAVQQLIVEGHLTRIGRSRAAPLQRDQRPLITVLACDWPSPWILDLRLAMQAAAEQAGCAFRTQHYLHWDDPAISEAIQRSTGVLFVPLASDLPERLLATLHEARARIVVATADLRAHGLATLDRLPATAVRVALDHLYALGHRRLTVFNVQPIDQTIRTRLDEARAWARHHPLADLDFAGEPVTSGLHPLPSARQQAGAIIAHLRQRAVLGLTLPAAMGVVRAAADHGLHVGRELAVAVIDGEGFAVDLVPSLTAVDYDPVSLAANLRTAVAWMRDTATADSISVPHVYTTTPRLTMRESTAELPG